MMTDQWQPPSSLHFLAPQGWTFEFDGEEREMTLLANNLEWSPHSVADLYRSRW
jgi:hypothetical protein